MFDEVIIENKYNFFLGNVYFLKFKRREVKALPKEFGKRFYAQGSTVYLRVDKINGKCLYTVRYDRYGYFIEIKGKSVLEVKAEFIKQVNLKYGEIDNVR